MSFARMLHYCAGLEAHNERSWFHQHHDEYLLARGDFFALLERLRFAVAEAAPALAEDILYRDVKDWVYRIARDQRFYRDRPPYEPSFRAYISADRRSWLPIGYFLCIQPGGSCFGTGMFLEETAAINRVRDFIALRQDEWESALSENGLQLRGARLKTVPRGYSPDHPAVEWLRYKNWVVEFDFPDEALRSFDGFAEAVQPLIRRTEPFRQLLLEAGRQAFVPKPGDLPERAL